MEQYSLPKDYLIYYKNVFMDCLQVWTGGHTKEYKLSRKRSTTTLQGMLSHNLPRFHRLPRLSFQGKDPIFANEPIAKTRVQPS
jgi:hypothetical protein